MLIPTGIKKLIQKNDPSISHLDLSNFGFADEDMLELVGLLKNNEHITSLNLSDNNITGAGVEALAKLNLDKLDISNNKIGRKGIDRLLAVKNIKKLELSGNGVSDEEILVKQFSTQSKDTTPSKLKKLQERTSHIYNDPVEKLAISAEKLDKFLMSNENSEKNLSRVLKHVDFPEKNDSMLIDSKKLNLDLIKPLEILDFSHLNHAQLADKEMQYLACALQDKVNLQSLDVSHTQLTDIGIKDLTAAFLNNAHLQSLDVSHTQLTDIGMKDLAVVLQNNVSLQSLDVSHTQLTDEGVVCLAATLGDNVNLQSLNVSHIQLTDEGVICLAATLGNNVNLQSLDVSHTQLTDEGVVYLAATLRDKIHLQSLDVSHTQLTDEGMKDLAVVLRNNVNLQNLDVSHTKLTDKGQKIYNDTILPILNKNRLRYLTKVINNSHIEIINNLDDEAFAKFVDETVIYGRVKSPLITDLVPLNSVPAIKYTLLQEKNSLQLWEQILQLSNKETLQYFKIQVEQHILQMKEHKFWNLEFFGALNKKISLRENELNMSGCKLSKQEAEEKFMGLFKSNDIELNIKFFMLRRFFPKIFGFEIRNQLKTLIEKPSNKPENISTDSKMQQDLISSNPNLLFHNAPENSSQKPVVYKVPNNEEIIPCLIM